MTIPEFTTDDFQSEVWKPVPGFESLYAVSSLGRVKRLTASTRAPVGYVLKQRSCDKRYMYCNLYKDQKVKSQLVHRIVAAAFIGSLPQGLQVNHKDGNGANNRPDNLEYVTPSENRQHAVRLGLQQSEEVREYQRKYRPSRRRDEGLPKRKYVRHDPPRAAYVAKGVWKHCLTDISPEERTALCSQCGITRIRPTRTGWRCGHKRH
jgi:hypothetical protein